MKPMIRIIDGISDSPIDREMTDTEAIKYSADQTASIVSELANKTAAELVATKRQIVLDKLGLTQDEAQALLG